MILTRRVVSASRGYAPQREPVVRRPRGQRAVCRQVARGLYALPLAPGRFVAGIEPSAER